MATARLESRTLKRPARSESPLDFLGISYLILKIGSTNLFNMSVTYSRLNHLLGSSWTQWFLCILLLFAGISLLAILIVLLVCVLCSYKVCAINLPHPAD